MRIFPQERVQQLTVKQIVDVPVQQIVESIAKVSQTIPQVRTELMFRSVDRGHHLPTLSQILFQRMATLYEQVGDVVLKGDASATIKVYLEALGLHIAFHGTSVPAPTWVPLSSWSLPCRSSRLVSSSHRRQFATHGARELDFDRCGVSTFSVGGLGRARCWVVRGAG